MRPRLDPIPTIFVHGLQDDKAVYSTLEGRKKWERRNRQIALYFAIILTVVTIALGSLILAVFKYVSEAEKFRSFTWHRPEVQA